MTDELQTHDYPIGNYVYYSGAFYEVAEHKTFPHGQMIGIYDEPPSKHIDFISPETLQKAARCPRCQNGCLDCGGTGFWII